MKQTLIHILRALTPSRLRNLMLRGAFQLMTEPEQDQIRLRYQMASMDWSLRRLCTLGFRPRSIVDIGAYEGHWARFAATIFPEAAVWMIEAQPGKETYLQRTVADLAGRASYTVALLGPEARAEIPFYELESGSSVLNEQSSFPRRVVNYPMTTLDVLASARNFAGADLLKLDTQGFELEILKGASHMLAAAECVLLEVSLISVNRDGPLLAEVVRFMDDRNFRLYDICSFIRRPLDLALHQSDLLFVKSTSPLVANQTLDGVTSDATPSSLPPQ